MPLARAMPSDAEPALVAQPPRLLQRGHRVVGVDPRGQVPQPVAAGAARGGDLAALHEPVEHHPEVAVVVPAAGAPRHHAGVGQLAGRQRPVGAEPVEDVAPAVVVGPHPVAHVLLPLAQLAGAGPLGHLGAEQRDVLGRPQRLVQLDQPLLVDGVPQLLRVERRPQPAPQHQLGARRDRAGRLELQQRELPDRLDQVGRPLPGQQLGPHRDAAGVGAAELVDRGHGAA